MFEFFRRSNTNKSAMEAMQKGPGVAVPTIAHATKNKEAYPYLEQAIGAMSPEDKEDLAEKLKGLKTKLEVGEKLTMLDITSIGVGGVATALGVLLGLMGGFAEGAPGIAAGVQSMTAPYTFGEDHTKQKAKIDSLLKLLE